MYMYIILQFFEVRDIIVILYMIALDFTLDFVYNYITVSYISKFIECVKF